MVTVCTCMCAVMLQGEAVRMIHYGTAPKITQTEDGATYDPMMKKAIAKVCMQLLLYIRYFNK